VHSQPLMITEGARIGASVGRRVYGIGMRHSHPRSSGFSLLEIAIVVVIIAIIATLLAPLLAGLADVDRSSQTYNGLRNVYLGIVGVPERGTFGYLGDVGDYPASLKDLIQDPGVTGWNGPYVSDVSVENDMILDGFGLPMEYHYSASSGAVTDFLAVISKGPDRGSSNTSATPNLWSTYAGGPLPSLSSYPSTAANRDNIVYPRFTDRVGLLSYQSVGQLNLNVFNYDYNSSVAAYVPACPNLYWVKVTSAVRPADTLSVPYNSGGASFDLIQGIYKVQLLNTTTGGVYWDETLTVAAGTSQNRTLNAPSVDSSSTPISILGIANSSGSTVTVYNFGTSMGSVVNGSTGNFNVRGCSQVTVRRNTGGGVVDSFIMPVDLGTYTRVVNTVAANYTVTNNTGTYRYLFVYLNNLLIGEVSGWGNRKVKVFRNAKTSETLTIKDQNGITRATVLRPGVGSTTL
jgi:prepilin-type N-terminal cleavage/methylation domain-containing protein